MPQSFPNSRFIAEAEVKGALYDLGAYPGLRLEESNSKVVGEVYEVDDETLRRLDEFEASSDYLRKEIEISLEARKMLCWTYEPHPGSYSFHTLIASGDWIEYARTKTDGPGPNG